MSHARKERRGITVHRRAFVGIIGCGKIHFESELTHGGRQDIRIKSEVLSYSKGLPALRRLSESRRLVQSLKSCELRCEIEGHKNPRDAGVDSRKRRT